MIVVIIIVVSWINLVHIVSKIDYITTQLSLAMTS